MATNGESPKDWRSDARDPSGFLSEIIGAPVTVKLNSGIVYKGTYVYTCNHPSFNILPFSTYSV